MECPVVKAVGVALLFEGGALVTGQWEPITRLCDRVRHRRDAQAVVIGSLVGLGIGLGWHLLIEQRAPRPPRRQRT